jgi:hypothetical protein
MPRLNLPYRNPLCQSAAGGVKTWLKGPRLATVSPGPNETDTEKISSNTPNDQVHRAGATALDAPNELGCASSGATAS